MTSPVQRRRLGVDALTTVPELYQEIGELLWSFRSSLPDREELNADSRALKYELLELAEDLTELPRAEEAAPLALAALGWGMLAGALDGTVLFRWDEAVEQPVLRPRRTYLQHPAGVLTRNLAQALEVGRSNWSRAEVDDLQLLSGYGRHQNQDSLQEARDLVDSGKSGFPEFQEFLLASFKGGYAMGVADAAVVFVGGEKPGAPPS